MRKLLTALISSIFLVFATAGPGQAHSLKFVEKQLVNKGSFFQSFDREAPNFNLLDGEGNKVTAKSFSGKVIVLYFVKSDCLANCSTQTEGIAEIQSMVNISPMRSLVQFVAVVVNANKDAPDAIRRCTDNLEIDPTNWVFLSGASDPINMQRLMEAFGHKDSKAITNRQEKNFSTHLIDMQGRWRASFNGTDFQPIDLVLYINALINFGSGIKDGHGE